MITVKVYNKDNVLLKTLELTEDDLVNKRFKRKKSVLDIFLDNNIEVFFGCMGGSCSACVCEVIAGKEHIDKEGLHPQVYRGIGEDDILTCISTFKESGEGNTIEIRLKYN